LLWPGFAINTIFYAAMLWLLWIASGKIRRFIRIRGHRCPACGYQIDSVPGIGPRCSECGAALPRQMRNGVE
jgi:tRNA(Ile2) C34 agmatinyltransferase TiaS